MKKLDIIAMVLLVIGGLNWGLIGLFSYNLIFAIFGMNFMLSKAVFTLIGLSAVYEIFCWKDIQKRWRKSS